MNETKVTRPEFRTRTVAVEGAEANVLITRQRAYIDVEDLLGLNVHRFAEVIGTLLYTAENEAADVRRAAGWRGRKAD